MKSIRFSKEGLAGVKKNLEDLRSERPSAVLDLKKARDMGDLSENGYYKAARSKLADIDRNLRYLAYQLKNAVVAENMDKSVSGIGSRVELSNGVTYLLVGDLEASPNENRVSLLSPVGRALEGKKAGENVEIKTPKGKFSYKIIKIGN